jgi:Fic family protein
LIQWITENFNCVHPVVLATIAHYNMVRIHPFDDGNGRGSRILMNFLLLRHWFVPVIVQFEDREEYYQALRDADRGEMHQFIGFIAKTLRWTLETALRDL